MVNKKKGRKSGEQELGGGGSGRILWVGVGVVLFIGSAFLTALLLEFGRGDVEEIQEEYQKFEEWYSRTRQEEMEKGMKKLGERLAEERAKEREEERKKKLAAEKEEDAPFDFSRMEILLICIIDGEVILADLKNKLREVENSLLEVKQAKTREKDFQKLKKWEDAGERLELLEVRFK
ncbi:hypothetical protein CMI37_16305 [Candidatus Pacearchaeota archaeon]|nr:hypothetical protein [Candidatus Pacearchaeota archaeon]